MPGISSALAAPMSAMIPVTMRDYADQLLILTGQGKNGIFPDIPFYSENRTLVFLMVRATLPNLHSALSLYDFPDDVPCCIIQNGTLPNEKIFKCDLISLNNVYEKEGIVEPIVLVIGRVVNALEEDKNTTVEVTNNSNFKIKNIDQIIDVINNYHKQDPCKNIKGEGRESVYINSISNWIEKLTGKHTKISDLLKLIISSLRLQRWKCREKFKKEVLNFKLWKERVNEMECNILTEVLLKFEIPEETINRVFEVRNNFSNNSTDKDSVLIADALHMDFLNNLTTYSKGKDEKKVIKIVTCMFLKLSDTAKRMAVTLDHSEESVMIMAKSILPLQGEEDNSSFNIDIDAEIEEEIEKYILGYYET